MLKMPLFQALQAMNHACYKQLHGFKKTGLLIKP